MSAVRENFPPDAASGTPGCTSGIALHAAELTRDVIMLFMNLDELAKASPAFARSVLSMIARELAARAEGKA